MKNLNKTEVFVIGHTHPDTDSICSAIAYANLKKQISQEHEYIAKRAGRLNEETQYVLERFQVEPPEYIADVRTQVSDIEIRNIDGVSRDISLKEAWNLMKDSGVVTLPIACGKQLEGLITVKDIVTAYMDVYDSKILSMSKTSYRSIVDTLDGELIVGHAERDYVNTGKIIIAAGSPETIEDVIDDGDIVITSNRYEAQFCAIQMNADMVIICNGSAVSKTIKKLAQEKNCVIITTPHDTYSTARLINQSAPVSYFMRSQGLVGFKKDDFIEDVKKVMAQKRYRDFPVLDRQGNYCGMLSRRFLLNMNKKQLILVDHNEKSQAIDGLEEAEILEIIDHHRLGALETMAPVFFRNQPVGCTATIIYKMYKENSVPFTKEMAGILCAAILSDTLAYRSPTCTEEDKNAGEDLAKIADISPVQFAKEMFGAGSKLAEKPANEIFNHDFKRFSINDIDFGVGQINSMDEEELRIIKGRLLPYLENACAELGLDMICFMLTNILDESTELLYCGNNAKELLEKAFETQAKDQALLLKDIVSRKKQLIPLIMRGMQE